MPKNLRIHIAVFTALLFILGLLPKSWVHHCPNHDAARLEYTKAACESQIKSQCSVCDFYWQITPKPEVVLTILSLLVVFIVLYDLRISEITISVSGFHNKAPPFVFA
jgi:hypothetical protein